ncbi:cupin domain-containing protein [Chitinophaga sp. Mgbs1]|uniref:Cupin domain-containing protein n=1 Tax=Chitinophaga solisilvae TaxID=1233460 RepID=A0A433WMR3_9BACT|nr:cupin domain-containing protein [Chitinophaga solisilvae]
MKTRQFSYPVECLNRTVVENNITITAKTQGQILGVAGGNYRIIISGDATGGAYAVIEMLVPPGGGPPPHEHPHMQEMFYLVEGELEFKTPAGKTIVQEGGFVNIPLNGSVHCFRNISDKYARVLCTVVPAGLDEVFRQVGIPAQPGEFPPPPPMTTERRALLASLEEKFGQKTYPPDYLDHLAAQ